MFKRVWEYFLLTMGVTPKGAEDPGRGGDKWAVGKQIKEREDQEQRAREARDDRERSG